MLFPAPSSSVPGRPASAGTIVNELIELGGKLRSKPFQLTNGADWLVSNAVTYTLGALTPSEPVLAAYKRLVPGSNASRLIAVVAPVS